MQKRVFLPLLLLGLFGCGLAEEGGIRWAAPVAPAAAPGGGSGSAPYTAKAAPAKPSGAPDSNVAPLAGALAAETNPDLSNIPGVQEVHWMTGRKQCRELYDKLVKQGENFTDWKFYESNMPRGRKEGHCKLLGPSARDDRFADRRYETD